MSGGERPAKPGMRQALADLIAWAKSGQTARALEAMELLDLTDEQLEMIFQRQGRVVKIPLLGRIS